MAFRRMVRNLGVTACAVAMAVSVAGPALAASQCLTRAQYDAERAIRYHNELMVVALTCQTRMPEKSLFSGYKAFTSRHQTTLRSWEKVLTSWLGSQSAFDDFRTRIANEAAKRAALQTPEQFCIANSGMIPLAMQVEGASLATYISSQPLAVASSRPLCDGEPAADPTVQASR
ncbi:MAG: hypothetical protein M3O22_09040 [Pseudomonadota bacterium]|nr:hypothetical protein [Pseudomonadota bacterium]